MKENKEKSELNILEDEVIEKIATALIFIAKEIYQTEVKDSGLKA